ncbi:uncharacterized protein LOC135957365 isoform X1 [Calliphora vicina]|uniref:uncharacterized protein LOC135957365 isoform X1 n=1 Tax=Calliphora vicina TaxID=7373 RepID=UPI00325BAED5
MNSKQIMFGVALIAFCCVSLSSSIKCYVCEDKKTCNKPKQLECNPMLAGNTQAYLLAFHKGASGNTTSAFYECFSEYIENPTNKYYYKGCTYAIVEGCKLPLNDFLISNKFKHECNQCRDKNGCNPAGRADIGPMTVIAAIIMGFVTRRVWQ